MIKVLIRIKLLKWFLNYHKSDCFNSLRSMCTRVRGSSQIKKKSTFNVNFKYSVFQNIG